MGITDVSLNGLITIKFNKPELTREIISGLPEEFLQFEIVRSLDFQDESCPEVKG